MIGLFVLLVERSVFSVRAFRAPPFGLRVQDPAPILVTGQEGGPVRRADQLVHGHEAGHDPGVAEPQVVTGDDHRQQRLGRGVVLVRLAL